MQTLVALVALVFTAVMTTIIGYALKATMGWRVAEEAEVEGIDVTTHGESAYDLELAPGSGVTGVPTHHVTKTQEVKA